MHELAIKARLQAEQAEALRRAITPSGELPSNSRLVGRATPDEQQRLRGIPVVGGTPGEIPGTRPDIAIR